MQWLCRLVTPPGGTILDPFAGTGTTGEAAYREGFNAVLIEREVEYLADIARRMALAAEGQMTRKHESAKARAVGKAPDHGPLFDPIARAAE
jgi:site-specific DNA-methyltransferase (adenine-specific)